MGSQSLRYPSAEREWAQWSYKKRDMFLSKLRQDCIRRGLNGDSWFMQDFMGCIDESDFNCLPQDLQEILLRGFLKYGFLVPFEE